MLFGIIDICKNGISNEVVKDLKIESLGWKDCKYLFIRSKEWLCGYFSPDNHFGDEMFFYKDMQGDTVVFMDGNIYNQNEVSALLGLPSCTVSAPKLVYHAFLHWGDGFPQFLNGDFSICVFQKSKKRVSFYRDHLGIRPLAVAFSDNLYFFSSDPIGLCQMLFGNHRPEHGFLINMFYNNPDMFILPNSNIENVLPGSAIHIEPNSMVNERYWFPERIVQDRSITFSCALDKLNNILKDAIKIRSPEDSKAAAHISSGLDSGVVAAMARKEYPGQKEFFGFSWSPPYCLNDEMNIEFDERERVLEVCQLNNITPLFINFDHEGGLMLLKNWRYPSEYFFEKMVIDIAKQKQVNIIFSGWGGDEFISVGHGGVDASLIKEFAWKSFLKKYPFSQPKKLIRALLYNFFFPGFKHNYAKEKTKPEIFYYLKNTLKTNRVPKSDRFKFGSRKKVHLQRLVNGHLGKRTSDWYILGRRYGIEYRYPLLDKRIIEYMLQIPTRCLVGGNNYRIILRFLGQSMLPGSVLENKSKDDPVKSHFFVEQASKARGVIIDQAEELLQNPLLQFLDTDTLRNDIEEYKKTRDPKLEQQITPILFRMKSAHEFIKGYYKNYNPQEKANPQTGGHQ